jgi:hypothetical protein
MKKADGVADEEDAGAVRTSVLQDLLKATLLWTQYI